MCAERKVIARKIAPFCKRAFCLFRCGGAFFALRPAYHLPVKAEGEYAQQLCYVGYGERLTLVNHSSKQLRHVILWYKQYDREKNCYLGGVAYSAHVFWLKEQEQRSLAPEHYHAGSAKVVTIELEEE